MRRNAQQRNLALSMSFLLLLIVAAGYFWLWKVSQPSNLSNVTLEEKYNTVEITSVKQQAQSLIQSKQNLSSMPVKAPSENVGRENPFASVE